MNNRMRSEVACHDTILFVKLMTTVKTQVHLRPRFSPKLGSFR